MRQNPALYGLVVESGTEPAARRLGRLQIGGGAPMRASAPLPAGSSLDENALSDYILLSIKRLEACGLLKISRVDEDNHNTWHFAATAFGRIASLYYISHLTVHQWLCGLGKTAPSETALLMLLLDSQELKAVTLRSEETACLNDMHSRLLLACAIDTEFEASDACKHLVLIVAHFNYMRPSVFSLACDLDYMVDALERLIAALKQILLHLRLYAFYRAALALETRIKRLRLEEAPFYECSATNCGGFVHLSLDVSEKAVAQYKGSARGCALLLYSGAALVYAAEFSKHFSGYIECPAKGLAIEVQGLGMHRREQLAVKTDYSLGALYRTGIHVCDPTYRLAGAMRGCIHLRPADEKAQGRPAKLTGASSSETFANILDIRLELDIQFIKVEAVGYAERLKLIDTQIHGLAGSVLVVCPGPPVDTANSLNTLNLLGESFDLLYECKQSAKGRGGHPRWVAGLGEAAGIAHKFSTVVFKGCRDARDFYPLYEVMRVCSGRRALVYEGEDFIEYFRMILGKRIAHHGSVNGNEN
ncbi:hypothetical protein PAPHI01_2090 [Pancytospora philotis]|nr:hypothetical protein PAPHI01_2090 [Pancytospora philotis]